MSSQSPESKVLRLEKEERPCGFLIRQGTRSDAEPASTSSIPKQEDGLMTLEESQEVLSSETLATESPPQGNSMKEYYQLQKTLLLATLILMGVIFFPVWYFYSLNTALNYLLGAAVGLMYLRFLGKDVERLGQQNQRIGSKGLGIFAVLIIVASRWQQLHILPVFLGFLTYKGAIIFYTLQTVFNSGETKENNS